MKKRKVVYLVLLVFMVFFFDGSSVVCAKEDIGADIEVEEKKFGPYKDEKRYYENIDVITYDEAKKIEEESEEDFSLNPVTWISNFVSDKKEDVTNSIQDSILAMFMSFIQLAFGINVAFSEWMLTVLSFANDATLINWMIDGVEDKIKAISGISGNNVQSGTGIYGNLLGVFSLITILYVVYQALFKRAPIESLKSIIQPIIAIALSIVLLSNFTYYLKGLNELGNYLSNQIVTLTTDDEKGEYNGMEDKLWKIFVHRPYLYVQFGTDNESKIGEERIKNVLLKEQTSDEKRAAIAKEVSEYDNQMMQPSSVIKRLVYILLFNNANGLLSLPIWLLSAILLGLQVWFVIVACLAPFVLVWSVLPGQFGILKRYAELLLYPITFKIIVAFIALILFTISDVVYSIPSTDGLSGYIIATFLQFVIFIVAFMFRNRIKKVFERGSTAYQHVKESWELGKGQVATPLKNSVQGAATVAGATVGGLTGGAQGVMTGISLGRTVGKTVTGEADLKDLPMQVLQAQANKNMDNIAKQMDIPNKSSAKSNVKEDENNVVMAADQLSDMNKYKSDMSPANDELENQKTVGTTESIVLKDIDEYRPKNNTINPDAVNSDDKSLSIQEYVDYYKPIYMAHRDFFSNVSTDSTYANSNNMNSNLVDINSYRPSENSSDMNIESAGTERMNPIHSGTLPSDTTPLGNMDSSVGTIKSSDMNIGSAGTERMNPIHSGTLPSDTTPLENMDSSGRTIKSPNMNVDSTGVEHVNHNGPKFHENIPLENMNQGDENE